MRLQKTLPLLLFLLFGLLGTTARAAALAVDDQAGLFSSEVVQKANRVIEHIQRDTAPPKQVVVLTLPELPAGKEADELARSRFSERSLDGVLVLVAAVIVPTTLMNSTSITQPIERARDAARAIAQGDLTQSVHDDGSDEVNELLKALENAVEGCVYETYGAATALFQPSAKPCETAAGQNPRPGFQRQPAPAGRWPDPRWQCRAAG